MSKKTKYIYDSIENLENLQLQLSQKGAETQAKELEEISFRMEQELKNLKFWIDSLYSYNGKSKSLAKKAASKENGKKGGRPPKAVTEIKRKIEALGKEIPELEHKIMFTDIVDERENLEAELKEKQSQLSDLESKLKEFLKSKSSLTN